MGGPEGTARNLPAHHEGRASRPLRVDSLLPYKCLVNHMKCFFRSQVRHVFGQLGIFDGQIIEHLAMEPDRHVGQLSAGSWGHKQ